MKRSTEKGNQAGNPVPDNAETRRQRAEERRRTLEALEPEALRGPGKIRRLLHELRVQQIELEAHNEELRRAQAGLEASRTRYADLYDHAPVGYVTVSQQGMILTANLTAATMLRVARGALLGKPLKRFILPADQDIYGRRREVLFAAGEPQVFELRVKRPHAAAFWARMDATLAKEPAGEPVCRVTITDVTESKKATEEREKWEAKRSRARRMESVGRLAGGVAHDFNNRLGVILGHAELALQKTDATDPIHAHLQEIVKAAARSADITGQLLTFACKQNASPRVMDLNETVEGLIKTMRPLIGEGIDLVWLPEPGLWPVRMDPTQVNQILANLCRNAGDAIGGAGRIIIETGNAVFDEPAGADPPGFAPGRFARLAVTDDGCGMDKATREHLFEPFFTTKEVGRGTGLGLATVYGIVLQNKGFIDVRSEPGKGTTLNVYVPRHEASAVQVPAAAAPEEPEANAGSGRGETVLVVEDQPEILEITQMILELLGYRVLAARTPGEALQLAEHHAGELRLLLTDVIMPEMNGPELVARLRPLCPHLKHLFMSGYTADVIAQRGVPDRNLHFLQKPFSMKDLAARVRAALDKE